MSDGGRDPHSGDGDTAERDAQGDGGPRMLWGRIEAPEAWAPKDAPASPATIAPRDGPAPD